jgi:hypothetical protein
VLLLLLAAPLYSTVWQGWSHVVVALAVEGALAPWLVRHYGTRLEPSIKANLGRIGLALGQRWLYAAGLVGLAAGVAGNFAIDRAREHLSFDASQARSLGTTVLTTAIVLYVLFRLFAGNPGEVETAGR